MIMLKKNSLKENKLIFIALLLGFTSIIGLLFARVINVSVAIIWIMMFALVGAELIILKIAAIAFPCLLSLMAFSAECIMQLQIEHVYFLSISYQRLIDFVLYCFIFLLFSVMTKRKAIGLVIGNIFFYIIATINLAITVFRGRPVYFADIFSLKTAVNVASEYKFPVSKVYFVCCITVGACILLCIAYYKSSFDTDRSFFKRVRSSVLLMILPIVLICFRIPTLLQLRGYYFSTTPYWLYSCSMSAYQMLISPPDSYDSERVPITETSDEKTADFDNLPNVIFIMNESFADLRVISSFEQDEMVMPYIDNLINSGQATHGNLYVSIYGGNTANTEFEVLTGVSMYNLPYDTTAYNLYLNSSIPSLVQYFDDLGYQTIAFHPSASTNYNRNNVYPNLGFQNSYFQEDFGDLKTLRTFTSDISNYEKVIEMLEGKNDDKRLFLFNLTVQNHGPYTISDSDFINKVELENQTFLATQQYLSCLKYSDEAFGQLIEYLKDYPEPTVVVFFGDHQAKIDDSFYEMLYRKSLSEISDEENQKRYIVPYLIWSNFDVKIENENDMSANYLGGFVIEQLGLPQTGYYKFLNNLRRYYPIVTAQGIDKSDLVLENNELFESYQNACYNMLFDKKNLWIDIHKLIDANE